MTLQLTFEIHRHTHIPNPIESRLFWNVCVSAYFIALQSFYILYFMFCIFNLTESRLFGNACVCVYQKSHRKRLYINIYIYRERERERESQLCVCVYQKYTLTIGNDCISKVVQPFFMVSVYFCLIESRLFGNVRVSVYVCLHCHPDIRSRDKNSQKSACY